MCDKKRVNWFLYNARIMLKFLPYISYIYKTSSNIIKHNQIQVHVIQKNRKENTVNTYDSLTYSTGRRIVKCKILLCYYTPPHGWGGGVIDSIDASRLLRSLQILVGYTLGLGAYSYHLPTFFMVNCFAASNC